MKLDVDELSSLKVKDLQRELKKRGLDTSGLKAALLERLKEHLYQEEGAPTEAQDAEQEKEKEDEDEKEKGKEEQEQEKEKQEEPQVETSEKEKDPAEAEKTEEEAEANGAEDGEKSEKVVGVKRSADAVESGGENAPDVKKAKKVSEVNEGGSPRPEDDDSGKPASSADAVVSYENAADGVTKTTEAEERLTLRIDNFVRPFTLNAVKALVQEFGNFVEEGFWMDAIKTHCFATYPSSEIAEKTKDALNGKVWPPENGRSLKVEFVDHTAMEVSKFGEANLPSRPKNTGNTSTQPRQKVTIDEFFQKTETKPVLYYLPLTDEQVKERKRRPSQQPEGQPRKRRHRGGRKRNRRGRFQRR